MTFAGILAEVADRRIVEAMSAGAFEDLDGIGLPLRIDDEGTTPAEWRLAFRLLRNAGMAPAWIELDRDLRGAADEARRALVIIPADDPRRPSAESRFREAMSRVNRSIDALNLIVPAARWQRRRVAVEREIRTLRPGPDLSPSDL